MLDQLDIEKESVRVSVSSKVNESFVIQPPASKSEANRVLIINSLAGGVADIKNLASARDTQTMKRLLGQTDLQEWDVLDAGTTMRFCTAFSAMGNVKRVMTGTERMQNRPIGILTDALTSLGAEINFLKKVGYPPFEISPIKDQKTDKLTISGEVSSQFISALLMIAPILPKGLTLELTGKIGSKPYIALTISIMKYFGIDLKWDDRVISVPPQSYVWNHKSSVYTVESDWSGASYWFSFVALSKKSKVTLKGYHQVSNQGDSILVEMCRPLGVIATFLENGDLLLEKGPEETVFEYDFTDCPDMAQTIAVICAAKGIRAKLSGLESLKVKETDRVAALISELGKFEVVMKEIEEGVCTVTGCINTDLSPKVITYEDHRMAMAFAPLAHLCSFEIEEPSVVKKSYPEFWDHMAAAGMELIFK